MSIKRQATTELNHNNWDQDDPADHEEMGSYKTASKDVLEKRVIRTAKRRSQLSTGDEAKKSVFSGFGGFNKMQPSSFDFLANLTNGSKPNGTPATKTEPASSNIFNSKPLGDNNTNASAGFFSTSVTKPSLGSNTQASPMLGVSSVSSSPTSVFTNSKVGITGADAFSYKPTPNLAKTAPGGFSLKSTPNVTQVTSSPFETPATTASKSLFSNSSTMSSSSTPFKIQAASSSTAACGFGTKSKDTKQEFSSEKESKKLAYYSKLKGLNDSVSDWIKKHVEETPLCILTPIFKDYERHLKEIQEEYEGTEGIDAHNDDGKAVSLSSKNKLMSEISTPAESTSSPFVPASTNSNGNSLFSAKPAGFGIMPPKGISGFSFGVDTTSTSLAESKSSVPAPSFSFAPSPNTSGENAPTPFSFGIGQKFTFSQNTQKSAESTDQKTENEDEDEPPKVEFTPVVEENSVYEKKCKIFVKKDGNFADKGVGTLYIKKVEDSGKHQLIVRANTNLGTLLLNLILASAVPTQRMGKNNVMLACIPTPDAKPPPTPVLIRVKTADEADELLETLNKYKA